MIIRFSSIGDIVLTSPIIRCLKTQTGAEVHFLCKAAFAPTIVHHPQIDKIWTINQHINEVVPALRSECFDAIIDLHKNLRSFHLKRLLARPSFAFPKLNFQKWLLCRLGIDRLPHDLHIVDRYFKSVEALGVKNDGLGLDFYFSSGTNRLPADTPKSALLKDLPDQFIAWVLGATHATKRLPATKINRVIAQLGIPVVLLGGKDVMEDAKDIMNLNANHKAPSSRKGEQKKAPLIDLVGKIKLGDSVAVLAYSACVVSPDTGLMHIAAALQKPIVSVWGNTVPAFGMTPYYGIKEAKQVLLEVEGLSCRPCSKIGYDSCPKQHFNCMEKQDENRLVKAIQDCLLP